MKSLFTLLMVGSFSLFAIIGCRDNIKDNETEFNREELLVNLADNFIAPGYSDLDQKIASLKASWDIYLMSPTTDNFVNIQNSWKQANLSFQHVCMFDFGPAMTVNLCNSLGIFPCDSSLIDNYTASGTYNLGALSSAQAVGFDALDYLLFRSNAKEQIDGSINCRNYISDLIVKMVTEVSYVNENWISYRSTFVNGVDQSSTGGFAMLVNGFSKEFETTKNAKLGIPLGVQSLGILRPDFLEARRSGFGAALYTESMIALKEVFLGTRNSSSGKGFDDYLAHLMRNDLNLEINTKFNSIISETQTWSSSFESLFESNLQELNNHYSLVQSTVPYIKSDMPSAFGVLITYQDNDGD
jgi:uncharacterized protein